MNPRAARITGVIPLLVLLGSALACTSAGHGAVATFDLTRSSDQCANSIPPECSSCMEEKCADTYNSCLRGSCATTYACVCSCPPQDATCEEACVTDETDACKSCLTELQGCEEGQCHEACNQATVTSVSGGTSSGVGGGGGDTTVTFQGDASTGFDASSFDAGFSLDAGGD